MLPLGVHWPSREVMTDVFLASPPAVSAKSALFIAWGQLLTYDLALFKDNSSEPFDVPCNDGGKHVCACADDTRLLIADWLRLWTARCPVFVP